MDSEALTWDDGKPPAADLPWEVEYSEEEMQKRSHGYQYNTGTLKMGFASHEKFALCGNCKFEIIQSSVFFLQMKGLVTT